MRSSSRTSLKSFLEQCSPTERSSLSNYLTPIEKQELDKLPKTYGNPLQDNESLEKQLRHIHPSWLSPFLRTLSEKDIGYFLAAIGNPQSNAVGKELLYAGTIPTLSQLGKEYLQKTLLGYLTAEIEDLLPLSFLPESPLNALLDIKNDLLNLSLDFLGLHDLCVEIKQIIEKTKLKKINEALSVRQQNYLKILLQSPEPVAFAKMGLTGWNEDPEKLKMLIRQRGANRLGKALFGQDPSLIWYVLHKLDFERAFLVKKLMSPMDNSRAVQILIAQIIEYITYMRQHHE
ncbi:MAG TPA: hypothetical protein VHK67_03595 [Rhabdochlamydiaceae bacterium]|jgi:hypothetical protein|nr:hypothetical protein [Rhabdochlamydiaceae bacterium]